MSRSLKVAGLMLLAALGGLTAGVMAQRQADAPESKLKLPDAAAAAVKKAFPDATVTDVGRERERVAVSYYEVELKTADARLELEVTADGTIIETERKAGELPKAVADAAATEAAGGKITSSELHEVRAELKLTPLAQPRVQYEIKLEREGVRREIVVGADGKVLRAANWDNAAARDDDDGD